MLKENEAGNLVSSADLLECIYLSATKPKSHLRPESLSFEGDEDFFTGGDIVEPSSIAPEAGPSTLQSRVQLPFEPLNRQRRVRGHRKGVAALLFPDAHETRKARRASTVRTTDDPFLTSAGPGAGPSTRPLALPSRPKLQQRHSPSQIPRWSGLAHSSLSTPVRSTTPIGEPKSKYAAGLSGRGSSKTPATQPSWMFAPRVGKPRQRSPRTPSIRSRRSSGDNTSAIAVGDDASRGSLGPALAEPSSAGELQLSETENLGDIDIAPSAFGVPPLALIEALERQAAVSTLPTVVVAPIKVYIPTESKRVPPLAADSPVEGGDGGQGRLEYHQGSIPNLVDIPTISSFGSLTPSYSSSNLAGAGKIPSFASSVPRVVREGPPSSGFAASASHSFNTLHSGYAPRSRLLQTIDEEKGSPSRASPPRHTVPGAISSPTLESPPSARPAAKNSGLWRKGKISLAVKSLFSRVKNSSLRSGMVLNATLANDRSLEVAQEADVGAGFGTEAPVRRRSFRLRTLF
ncbi:hypothetical protein DFP72DRAFT_117184 [Ephemerocybe angulata]|uniref:Uncharacterized protein n=1 Tax=Ephemerocybe angulata TaxID=980116 RepID=A0A8H6I6G3_9AGAR|nr:hypothetical protein DFP72DRAFT_117184 [Tulosesus angulatus]